MGTPTTAAYAIAAAVIAPGLAKIGVPVLVAHMFIFYFAVISAITPPVALASFAAAGMAQADPWKTSWIALKMGLAAFIVPFMFFYAPVLLMKGDWADTVQATVNASIGVWFLASSTGGWFGGKLAKHAARADVRCGTPADPSGHHHRPDRSCDCVADLLLAAAALPPAPRLKARLWRARRTRLKARILFISKPYRVILRA